jgi:hypothetical protein
MTLDRVLALVAMATLIAFVGLVAIFVGIPDLIVVSVVVLAMAVYDFWRALRPGRRG